MRQLGEMVVDEPVAGSFSYFADKYCGHLRRLSVGLELLGAVRACQHGRTDGASASTCSTGGRSVPTWVSALGLLRASSTRISLLNVKAFGEMEFWFAIIKVVAIVGMIVFGAVPARIAATPARRRRVANLWQHGGFFPNGVAGLVMAMAVIMFSFGGLELIGITAAEADDPSRDDSARHQPGHLPHPDLLHRRAGHVAVAVPVAETSSPAAARSC